MHPESYAGRGHALVKHSGHSPPSNIFLVLRKHTFSRGDGGLMDQWRSIAEKASRQCVCLTQSQSPMEGREDTQDSPNPTNIGESAPFRICQNRRESASYWDMKPISSNDYRISLWALGRCEPRQGGFLSVASLCHGLLTHRATSYRSLFLGLPLLESTRTHDTSIPSDLA